MIVEKNSGVQCGSKDLWRSREVMLVTSKKKKKYLKNDILLKIQIIMSFNPRRLSRIISITWFIEVTKQKKNK